MQPFELKYIMGNRFERETFIYKDGTYVFCPVGRMSTTCLDLCFPNEVRASQAASSASQPELIEIMVV